MTRLLIAWLLVLFAAGCATSPRYHGRVEYRTGYGSYDPHVYRPYGYSYPRTYNYYGYQRPSGYFYRDRHGYDHDRGRRWHGLEHGHRDDRHHERGHDRDFDHRSRRGRDHERDRDNGRRYADRRPPPTAADDGPGSRGGNDDHRYHGRRQRSRDR